MGAFGRGSRPGRRLSSSSPASSPFISTVTIAVFVAFCLLAVWMLSANSFSPSSHTSTDNPAVRFRASLASSHAKPSRPFIVYKDTGSDGGDSDGGGGGVGEEDAAAEEKLAAPVVSERADVGGEGREKQEEEERRRQQQRAEGQQGRAFDGDSHRERPTEGGTDGNGDEAKSQELPSHTSSYEDNNGDGQQQPQQEEEAMENTVQLEEESGQMETRGHRSDGEGDDQQQHPLQQETEDVGEDSQKLQRQQESEDGGSREDESQSRQEQTDAEGDQNQMEQMTEREAGGAEGQDENYQQQVEGNEKPVMDSLEDTEREVVKGLDEEPQQQGTDEKLTDEPHVSASLTDGAHQEAEVLPDGDGSVQNMPWSTQADQSHSEKERRKESKSQEEDGSGGGNGDIHGHEWKLCNATAGPDYIPCLDNEEALRHVHNTRHFQHRERHCPEEAPTCLVPLPKGYRRSIEWPKSRDSIWYNNVPHTKLALVKGHQNWLKVTGEYLIFPGGGTQFIHGALHYIEFIQKSVRNIAWGKHTRVVLDVGCGVASFGGYLFEKDVITMSFAPKDEHEAQIQLALERGIPAISAVMGSQRLPFPSKVFDLVHCARCRVPWHAEGGTLLLELNRVLRPGGYFVWSATPVYQKLKEDVEIWREMTSLTKSMCWELITIRKDRLNSVGAAIYQKPTSNECYDNRKQRIPPMCNEEDDPDAAWYVPLQSCMHRVPTDASERGSQWPQEWPRRLRLPPSWLNSSEVGVYGKPAPSDFTADYGHWKRVIAKSYLHGMGVDWSKVRNVMDMRAVYGGFAAALKDLKIWVMNVVNVDSPDTLPIIYERGLFGIYHDWCESFSTYPRTYDLLHADQLFSNLKKRCNIVHVVVEVDRILRPGGKLLIRDEPKVVSEIESQLRSLHWEVHLTFAKGREGILCAEKSDWRPEIFLGSS